MANFDTLTNSGNAVINRLLRVTIQVIGTISEQMRCRSNRPSKDWSAKLFTLTKMASRSRVKLSGVDGAEDTYPKSGDMVRNKMDRLEDGT